MRPIVDHTYYIGFGSNLGRREAWLARALKALESASGTVVKVSAPYYNPAHILEGETASAHPDYLNVVIKYHSELSPYMLLENLQAIERALGRDRKHEKRWDNRTVDLDILACDDLVTDTPELVLPHPRMHLRDFVVMPLLEIAPEWRHPLLGKSVRELSILLSNVSNLAVSSSPQ